MSPFGSLVTIRTTLRFLTALAAAAVLIAAPSPSARAQGGNVDQTGNGGRHSIQGRLVFPSGKRADLRLKVRLISVGSGEMTVLSDLNGSFSFLSLRPGSYTVVIEGGDFYETSRESVFIEPTNISMPRGAPSLLPISRPYTLQVYLRHKQQRSELAKPGVLSAALAGIPKPAVEMYDKAVETARKGSKDDYRKAVEHLKAAIALHPEFALALSEMGVLYMKLKEPDKAAEVLVSALKMAPDDYGALLTYGRALFDLQKYPESEAQFRRALERNTSSPSAHFYVGMILLKRQDYDGAEKALSSAIKHGGDEMAVAHYYLGGIYWGRKEYKRAADELETYLRLDPNAQNAGRIRETVKELRRKN